MTTLIDRAEFTANEIYEIGQTDPVEGAGTGASFNGIGISNQPHQQLANRTAFLKQRQDTNIANLGLLQSFVAGFTGALQTNGYIRIPIADIQRGPIVAIIQWGFHPAGQAKIVNDTQYTVSWPIRFPTAILIPPMAANYYSRTGGMNTVASVVSYNQSGATFVLDVPRGYDRPERGDCGSDQRILLARDRVLANARFERAGGPHPAMVWARRRDARTNLRWPALTWRPMRARRWKRRHDPKRRPVPVGRRVESTACPAPQASNLGHA